MSAPDPELLREFLWTTREETNQLEAALVAFERGHDREAINGVYRSFHSVKGAAGLLQFAGLEQAAHACEGLLAPYRKHDGRLPSELVTLLLLGIDAIKQALVQIESDGREPAGVFSDFLAQSAIFSASVTQQAAIAAASATSTAPVKPPVQLASAPPSAPAPVMMAAAPVPAPAPVVQPPVTQTPPAANDHPAPAITSDGAADTSVRVDITLLDRLMNLVGELVLARNQLLQVVGRYEDPQLTSTSQAINQVTSDVQEHIMRTRMQPIGNIFNKFPRLVRDLGKQLDKRIELDVQGKETELDRTLLEALRDPFTHIIRNACDHGLERADQRTAAGKPAAGTIYIRAFHEGGQVIVEVADDGRGIDPERIKAKALGQGLITATDAGRMSAQEFVDLICHPGFSTAEQVTSISGRGVGMDVVRKNIEKMGGQLEIRSQLGKGTTIRLKIPLTLAIIPALMVRAGNQLYGIPQLNLVELVGFENSECANRIERVRGAEVYRLRERLLTLVRLDRLLSPDRPPVPPREDGMTFIVVVADGSQQFGLVVDEILDTEEIVVKPLSRHLAGIEHFAGATIRGDGRVSLILDMAGVAHAAQVANSAERAAKAEAGGAQTDLNENEFLVFRLADQEQFAIPLQLVNRIEMYERSCLTEVNGLRMICHDDKLTPAVELDRCGRAKPLPDDGEPVFAIVLKHRSNAAVIARQLVDNLSIDLGKVLDNQQLAGDPSVMGLTVVGGVPTSLLDVHGVLDRVFPPQSPRRATAPLVDRASPVATARQRDGGPRVLFCEDAQFFQNTISRFMQEIGLAVDICNNGQEGLTRLEADPARYALILTDLEMPVMDGWDLIKAVRRFPHYDKLPILALTSLSDEASRQRALQAGASRYLVKLQREELIQALGEFITLPTVEV